MATKKKEPIKFKSEDVDKLDALCERGREQVKALLRNAGVLEEPQKKKRWRAGMQDEYLYIDAIFGIKKARELRKPTDYQFYNAGNYFQHQEDAEALSYILRLHTFLFAENVRLYERYWEPSKGEDSCHLTLEYEGCVLLSKLRNFKELQVSFKTEADAMEAYDNLPQDLKDYFKEKK